jgi:ABC-type Na+ efflux pump permease subunit
MRIMATQMAKWLIGFGVFLIILGGIIMLFNRLGVGGFKIPLGRLPGDIRIQGEHFTCFIPIASSILLSILLTLILNLVIRFLNR